jgi:hypothetical protein
MMETPASQRYTKLGEEPDFPFRAVQPVGQLIVMRKSA